MLESLERPNAVDPARVEAIAQIIANGRRSGVAVDPLPPELYPSWAEMYLVHDRVDKLLGLDAVGWKVGAASREVQIKEGLPDALVGRIYAHGIWESPAIIPAGAFINFRLCESEFVLTVGEDLRPGTDPISPEDLAPSIATVRPALEIGDMVFQNWYESSKFWASCLDNAGGSQLVLGPETPYSTDLRLGEHEMTLYSNGDFVRTGDGSAAMGDPLISAAWAINLRRRAGDLITAGTLISTGTCTGHHFAEPGEHVRIDFGTLGETSAILN